MRIDLQLCRHSEMKNFCKWFSDGNCKLITDNCKAPCEKYIDKVVKQLEELKVDENETQEQIHHNLMMDIAIEIVKVGNKE